MTEKTRKSSIRKAKQERSRATIDTILDAAAQVLIRDGYYRASTNRIAERAGVSVGSIYQYFGNKDHVFAALIDREVQAVATIVTAQVHDSSETLMDVLRRLITLSIEAWSYGPLLYQQLQNVPDAVLQARVTEAKAVLEGFIRALFAEHRAELRVANLDVATFVVINAAIGLSANSTPEIYGDRLAEMTVELWERYLIA